jgi:retron-type reverse transcriptase
MAKSNSARNIEAWRDTDWRKAEKYVFRLQKRIYAAARRGDIKRCRKLQKTLMRSWYNKVLAVRRVTQENQGVRRESRTLGATALNNWRAVSPGELSLSVPR